MRPNWDVLVGKIAKKHPDYGTRVGEETEKKSAGRSMTEGVGFARKCDAERAALEDRVFNPYWEFVVVDLRKKSKSKVRTKIKTKTKAKAKERNS